MYPPKAITLAPYPNPTSRTTLSFAEYNAAPPPPPPPHQSMHGHQPPAPAAPAPGIGTDGEVASTPAAAASAGESGGGAATQTSFVGSSSSSSSTTILIALAGPLSIDIKAVDLRAAVAVEKLKQRSDTCAEDVGTDEEGTLDTRPIAAKAPSAAPIWGVGRDDVHMVSVAFSADGLYLAAAAMNGGFAIGRYDHVSDSYLPCRDSPFDGAQLCYIPERSVFLNFFLKKPKLPTTPRPAFKLCEDTGGVRRATF